MNCKICGAPANLVSGSLYKCNHCKTLQRVSPSDYYSSIKSVYDESYYDENYKKRYGKTLTQDIDNLRKIANNRLDVIENIYLREGECKGCSYNECSSCYVRNFVVSLKGRSLLDVGCGVGIFIEVAKSRGFDVWGVDINKNILHLVSKEIGSRIMINDFESFEINRKFDIITMWYVLEHLPDPEKIIAKVWNMLKYGGIFAVSTPNGDGASSRFNPEWYYSVVPKDHIFEFSPKSLSLLLSRNGFKVVRVINTGFHPERIVKVWGLRELFGLYQKIFNVGDTFEIYAVKKTLNKL